MYQKFDFVSGLKEVERWKKTGDMAKIRKFKEAGKRVAAVVIGRLVEEFFFKSVIKMIKIASKIMIFSLIKFHQNRRNIQTFSKISF